LPPHSPKLLNDLKRVLDSWLSIPGKKERTFMLGHFDSSYLNNCPVMIISDEAKNIVGFLNQVPTKTNEANVDMMCRVNDAAPNVNDFMFVNFLHAMHKSGYKTVNLGMCPLAGIAGAEEDKSVVTDLLKFVYQNGNRLFGFSGLERFKSKFEPTWRNRYVAYQDGIVGFTRAMMALNKAMQKKRKSKFKLRY